MDFPVRRFLVSLARLSREEGPSGNRTFVAVAVLGSLACFGEPADFVCKDTHPEPDGVLFRTYRVQRGERADPIYRTKPDSAYLTRGVGAALKRQEFLVRLLFVQRPFPQGGDTHAAASKN